MKVKSKWLQAKPSLIKLIKGYVLIHFHPIFLKNPFVAHFPETIKVRQSIAVKMVGVSVGPHF